jgi:hypothetical protein
MARMNRLGVVAAALPAVLGGCGWTARDSYYQSQKVSFQAASGDRSVVVFAPEATWPTERRGTAVAAAGDR